MTSRAPKQNILWISPNLNHYKARVLSRLAESEKLEVTVLAGAQVRELGHRRNESKESFALAEVKASKKSFQTSPAVYVKIIRLLFRKKFDVVLMPVEKKLSLLIFFLFFVKFFFRFKLVSYNHPQTRGLTGGVILDRLVTRFLFSLYYRVIFYTREAMEWTVGSKLVAANKAFFANNTLDTDEIWQHYDFEINSSDVKVILYIGRLQPNKQLDLLFKYYEELKKNIPHLKLIIIGDGPEAPAVKSMTETHHAVEWLGAVVDEAEIAAYMRRTHLVFVPGWSGLSIVHAFSYGKPYVTIDGNHPPEFVYLHDNVNGLILEGNLEKDCERIAGLLNDDTSYRSACLAAYEKAKELSIENWCCQIQAAFLP